MALISLQFPARQTAQPDLARARLLLNADRDVAEVAANNPECPGHPCRVITASTWRARANSRAWWSEASTRPDETSAGRSTLVLSEGVLIYLAAENVADLAAELAKRTAYRWWLTDIVSPLFLVWGARIAGGRLSAAGTPLKFAPPEGPDFFRSFGWQIAELRSAWLETRRLGREQPAMRLAWIASFGKRRERYRRAGSFVLMERDQEPLPA